MVFRKLTPGYFFARQKIVLIEPPDAFSTDKIGSSQAVFSGFVTILSALMIYLAKENPTHQSRAKICQQGSKT